MAKDLRTFLDDNTDLVLRVPRAVAPEFLSTLIVQADRPVLFEAIEGFPDWRLCDLLFRDRVAQSRVLGTAPADVLRTLADRLARPPMPPKVVNTGPVKDRILKGDAVDLASLPGFQHGVRDSGRALIAMNVCRGPDGGNVNFSFTRLTPLDARRATYLIGSSPHMREILHQWAERGERMPMACVIGTHPAYEIMASYSVPGHLESFGELEMVGNLIGEPVELVPCETIPLEVPAHAEVVIEGWVDPAERHDDGPGPSQALYYLPGVTQQPVFEASAMTTRASPILRQHNTLMYSDHQPLLSLPHEALLFERLRAMAIDVREVFYVPWGGTLACVVQMTPRSDGEVRNVLMSVLGERWPNAKLAVAIDDDVDIGRAEDLVWSISTRVDPERDLLVVPGAKGHPIDPTARIAAGGPRHVITGKWGIDATKPPLTRPDDRARFERTVPPHAEASRLEDYL
jgi:UbiD family decarboxylase